METVNKLAFEVAEWTPMLGVDNDFMRFRVGTCEGLWRCTDTTYDILAVINDSPGNGHFEDVLQWFESSCKRDKKDLRILEVWNKGLMNHLITKRGFKKQSKDNVIKKWRKCLTLMIV